MYIILNILNSLYSEIVYFFINKTATNKLFIIINM